MSLPIDLHQVYPRGGFESIKDAQAWADKAALYLDRRDYFRVEPRGDKFVVVQDVKSQ